MTQLESHSPRRARRDAERGQTHNATPASGSFRHPERATGGGQPTQPNPTVQPGAGRGGNVRTRSRDTAPPGARRERPTAPSSPRAGRTRRRGSHATTLGQGFSWVILWTIIGALIPGSGLIVAGFRRTGYFVLTLLAVGVGFVIAASLTGNPVDRVVTFAFNPKQLVIATCALAGIGLALIVVILLTNSELRRYATLSPVQKAFSALVVLALIAGVAVPTYKLGSYALIQRDLVTSVFTATKSKTAVAPNVKKPDPWAAVARVNVLLVGSDAGPDRTGIRPDTLILASINTHTGDTVLFSLPRNLEHAPFPVGTAAHKDWPDGFWCPKDVCLLNAVWQWGETTGKHDYPGDPMPGLTATEQAVEGITGLKPNYYAMLNLEGFKGFVDALGGITVNVTERLPIAGSTEDPNGTTGWIEPGPHQHLDGYHALWFARSRRTTTDYDRMVRQRCVIGAIAQQANPVKLARAFPALAATAKQNISTDIPAKDLPAWVVLALRIKKAQVRSLPFTSSVINSSDPDFEKIQELVQAALTPVHKASHPSTSPSPSATHSKSKSSPTVDPSVAQDVTQVC